MSAWLLCLIALCTLLISDGCGRQEDRSLDHISGFVTANQQLPESALTPISIPLDSDIKYFHMLDHLVFLSTNPAGRLAAVIHLSRGIQDNRFNRAQREFFGFLFDGKGFRGLPFTKTKHDSARLETSYDFYVFGGLQWTTPHTAGRFRYDRRDTKFEVEFAELQPVQHLRSGDWRQRTNAIGKASLTFEQVSTPGYVFYELLQLEGYNPMADKHTGVDRINYDWIALLTESGRPLLISTDSSTANNLIMKNFVALRTSDGVHYAEGREYVRMSSSEIVRDPKIYEWLANKKRLIADQMGLEVELSLTDKRVFYSNGYAVAEVEGTMRYQGREESVWGVLERAQQPKTDSEALR